MSSSSRSAASPAPPAPDPAAPRRRSSPDGVVLALRGWREGFAKAKFTRLLRDGGVGLNQAVDLTGRLLAGERITVRLGQFIDFHGAQRALVELGVADVMHHPTEGHIQCCQEHRRDR